jgi:quercetin dioxygenase-like cupin family protein
MRVTTSRGVNRGVRDRTRAVAGHARPRGRGTTPPDFTGSPHYHTGDEVLYILEGFITFTLDRKADVTLKAGETCHIPAKQVHFGKTTSESVKFLSILVQEIGTPRLRLDAE